MYSKIIGLFSCLMLLGCIFEPKVPSELIQKEKMSIVLTDILLTESVAYNLEVKKDSQKVMFHKHYKPAVLLKHGISSAIFDSSINFYMKHPELLLPIANETESMLGKKLDDLKSNKK